MVTDSVEIFHFLQCIINVFNKMTMSYDQLKERYKAQVLYYINMFRFTYIATLIFHISCLVYILISECSILRTAQHLEFIFRVPTRNNLNEERSRLKRAYGSSPKSVAMPL
jgi:hypothetical protein